MNRIERGKTGLLGLGVLTLLLGLLGLGGGIWLVVAKSKALSSAVNAGNIVGIVGGALIIIVGLLLLTLSVYLIWVGCAVKATKGSIADDNLAVGTVNMQKCPKCGSEIKPEDKVCGNCGASLSKTTFCPECGAEIDSSKKFCTKCGAEIK